MSGKRTQPAPKAPRRYAQTPGFRKQYPASKAFLAPQERLMRRFIKASA